MSRISALIKKDLYFNQVAYLVIFAATILLMAGAIGEVDGSEATGTLNYLVYTCGVSIILVPFSYNLDDASSTRRFLAVLPVTFDQIITSKYLLSVIMSTFLAGVGFVLFNSLGVAVLYRCMLIPIVLSLFMTSVFIFAFYNWDANIARLLLITPIVLFALMAKTLEQNDNINGDLFDLKILMILVGVVFIFAITTKKITVKIVNGK